jgi:hypothetical protein
MNTNFLEQIKSLIRSEYRMWYFGSLKTKIVMTISIILFVLAYVRISFFILTFLPGILVLFIFSKTLIYLITFSLLLVHHIITFVGIFKHYDRGFLTVFCLFWTFVLTFVKL